MQKDAESHAEEDKRKRQLAEERNKADTMCWSMEKLLKEHDAKLGAADKEAVQKAIEKTREAAKTDDLEQIKSATNELEQASHALSKTLYEKAGVPPTDGAAPVPPRRRRNRRRPGRHDRRRRRHDRRRVRGEVIDVRGVGEYAGPECWLSAFGPFGALFVCA